VRTMTCFASLSLAACLAGCLPLYEPRNLSAEGSRLEAESGGGLDYREVQSDALDGRTFQILMSEGGKDPVANTLTFANGRMESEVCREHGFFAAPYEAQDNEDESIHFTCDVTNDNGVETRWSGTVKDDKIAGTAETTQPGKDPILHTFESALETEPHDE
jgi:hypothetical protein